MFAAVAAYLDSVTDGARSAAETRARVEARDADMAGIDLADAILLQRANDIDARLAAIERRLGESRVAAKADR